MDLIDRLTWLGWGKRASERHETAGKRPSADDDLTYSTNEDTCHDPPSTSFYDEFVFSFFFFLFITELLHTTYLPA